MVTGVALTKAYVLQASRQARMFSLACRTAAAGLQKSPSEVSLGQIPRGLNNFPSEVSLGQKPAGTAAFPYTA